MTHYYLTATFVESSTGCIKFESLKGGLKYAIQ